MAEVGFGNDKIFLLSIEEYEKYKMEIPPIKCWWWLRSPGYYSLSALGVDSDGDVDEYGFDVPAKNGAVRPALKYSGLKVTKSFEAGCFVWNDVKWKIIDYERKIAVAYMPIAFYKFDDKSNEYKKSSIRFMLDFFCTFVFDENALPFLSSRRIRYETFCKFEEEDEE